MTFIILFLVGFVGIGIALIILDGFAHKRSVLPESEGWYDPPMESYIAKSSRVAEKTIVIVLRKIYFGGRALKTHLEDRIRIMSWTKGKVRSYLYEHDRENNPLKISTFLKHVEKDTKKKSRVEKSSKTTYTPENPSKE